MGGAPTVPRSGRKGALSAQVTWGSRTKHGRDSANHGKLPDPALVSSSQIHDTFDVLPIKIPLERFYNLTERFSNFPGKINS